MAMHGFSTTIFPRKMTLKSKNIWWNPRPPKRFDKTDVSFTSEMKYILANSSMHCYSKLVEPGRTSCEKFMWLIAHMIAFVWLAILLNCTWKEYHEKPLTTNLHNPLYPVKDISFPAVSLCSNNRIMKSAALEYANYLNNIDPENRSVDFFIDKVRKMSSLYDSEVTYLKEMTEFQTFLDKYDTKNLFYDTRERMKVMTPPCTKLLLKCSTAGKMVPCLSPGMFQMSITHRGYCCLFNANETESLISFTSHNTTDYYQQSSGYAMGLSIVVNSSSRDYFYQMFDLNGFILHVYDSNKYDDVTSGVIAESFISRATESFVRVFPQVMNSDDEIRRYPTTTRHCIFEDEFPGRYGTRYSSSNCITSCRIRSIVRLCGCIPFYMPRLYVDADATLPYCNFNHVSCLNNFQIKWMTVITVREGISEFEGDLENSLYCPECVSSCSYIRYKISLSTLPLKRYEIRDSDMMTDVKNLSEVALIHIYFAEPSAWLFKQRVNSPWYQVLSNIGGICGIVTGFSLAALCEFVYFFLTYIYYWLKKNFRAYKQPPALIIYP